VLAVIRDVREILDGGPARPGQGEPTIVLPLVGGGERALDCEGTKGRQEESGVMSLAVVAMRGKVGVPSEERFRDASTQVDAWAYHMLCRQMSFYGSQARDTLRRSKNVIV
jgi:hypothetical protein